MLFPPKSEERIGQPAPVRLEAVDGGMARRTKRDQPSGGVPPGLAVMNSALIPCPAALAAVAVAGQDLFTVSAKAPARVGHLLVTAAAQPGDGGVGPAAAKQGGLGGFPQGTL